MIELNEKYVLHIPYYKSVENKLILIELDNILNELFDELKENNYNSFYMQNIKSFYNENSFDELIITVFAQKNMKPAGEIFFEWCSKNHDTLAQQSYGYELNNTMFIITDRELLDKKIIF